MGMVNQSIMGHSGVLRTMNRGVIELATRAARICCKNEKVEKTTEGLEQKNAVNSCEGSTSRQEMRMSRNTVYCCWLYMYTNNTQQS
jgi:hypothetical protein